MPCGWEGNRRFVVAPAMRQWFIHLRAHGLRKGDEQLSTLPTLLTEYSTLYLKRFY